MNTQSKQAICEFKGLSGVNGLPQTNLWLTDLCKFIGENNLFINHSALISDVLQSWTKVDPEALSFMETTQPNAEGLRKLTTVVEWIGAMPSDQKKRVAQALWSIELQERKNLNPYHCDLAAHINGLLVWFKAEGAQIQDEDLLREEIYSVVEAYRPAEEE